MLKGKVALVTGSTSGIGWAMAERFAGEGCDIVLNGLGDAGEIEARRRKLAEAHGVQVIYSDADMARPEAVRDMIRTAEARFGAIDILVNNAGIQHVAPVDEFPPEKWEQIIAINLSHAFHATHHALPGMRARGWGRVINIASVHGLVGSAGKAAYVAAKHGIIGLTKVTALDLAGSGITCNAICPGWVKTPLVMQQIEARAQEKGLAIEAAERDLLAEKQPGLEFVTAGQIAAYAVFLCSDDARTVTGAQVQIDGAWTAQ